MLVGHIKIHNLPSVAIYAAVFAIQLHAVQVSWLTFFLLTSLPIQPLNQFFDLVIRTVAHLVFVQNTVAGAASDSNRFPWTK